jgi:inosose dehydratase
MATVVQTFDETKRLMDNTDPRYVWLCFDTGHFTFAKEDAVRAAQEFGPRIGHVHLKDIRPDRMETAYKEGYRFRKAVLEGCFTIPGDGCVDYPGVFEALRKAHYEGWFIVEAEQDPAKANPFEYACMARDYIRRTASI